MAGKIGMMNEAYFLGKGMLIDWINNFLQVNIVKVEDMATGSLYCNLWDALHPGTLPMKRVDFNAKFDYEWVNNWKLLQTAFQRCGVDKPININRLIKARYQDNLEFFQWMYKYAHDVYNGDPDNPDYDAVGRRSRSKGGKTFGNSNARRSTSRRGKENVSHSSGRPDSARTNARPSVEQRSSFSRNKPDRGNNAAVSRELEQVKQENAGLNSSLQALNEKYQQLQGEQQELSSVAKEIEKERDFYFGKVLEVERLCKEHEDQSLPLLDKIYNILYQSQGDGEKKEGEEVNETEKEEVEENASGRAPVAFEVDM